MFVYNDGDYTSSVSRSKKATVPRTAQCHECAALYHRKTCPCRYVTSENNSPRTIHSGCLASRRLLTNRSFSPVASLALTLRAPLCPYWRMPRPRARQLQSPLPVRHRETRSNSTLARSLSSSVESTRTTKMTFCKSCGSSVVIKVSTTGQKRQQVRMNLMRRADSD